MNKISQNFLKTIVIRNIFTFYMLYSIKDDSMFLNSILIVNNFLNITYINCIHFDIWYTNL